jgi:peroxiredoxin
MKKVRLPLLLTALLLALSTHPVLCQSKKSKTMKVQAGQQAPDFQTEDIYGMPVALTRLRGQPVLISFMRNAGCPVCNFQVHQLLEQADSLKARNIAVVLVYQSSRQNLLEYLSGQSLPFTFIADPDNKLYTRYGIEQGMGKMMKGMFKGALGKMQKGKKLFKSPIRQDGKSTTIGADFLLDGQGKVIKVHYGEYLGDHLQPSQILAAF